MVTVIILVRVEKKMWAYSLLNALHLLADYILRILPQDVGLTYRWRNQGWEVEQGSRN